MTKPFTTNETAKMERDDIVNSEEEIYSEEIVNTESVYVFLYFL